MSKKDLISDAVYVPTSDDEGITIDISDIDVATSGRDLDLTLTHPKLAGLDIPKVKQGKMKPLDEERWIVVVETLMQRGVSSLSQMHTLTGLAYARCGEYVAEVRDRWAKSLTMGQINSRREQIYLEAERVKEECWQALQTCTNESMRLAYLKMIIDCGKRQSALVGAERININVESKVEARHKSAEEMAKEGAGQLSISVEQFSAIGDMLSKQLTDMRKEGKDDG